jgi:4-amino-4-deoxy-L-arabinose transferase-like glycosyltransferase
MLKQKRIRLFFTNNKILIAIILLSAILRFYKITDSPPSLNWDEVSHGYNAYSILKSGRDEWGEILPVIFRAYGDYKLPVYVYTTVVSVALFGLNTFSVRLPSILAGVLSVVFSYLLIIELFKHKKNLSFNIYHLALTSAALMAVEPWSLFLSRAAFEANLALTFIIAGIYYFLKGGSSSKYFLLSTIFFGISVWTYNSARIFVPLFLAFLIIIYRKNFIKLWSNSKRIVTCYLLLVTFFFAPMFYQLLSQSGQARYGWVSIIDEGAISQINEARGSSGLSPNLNRLINNKGTYFIGKFFKNWASHYSADFLFLEGGSDYQFNVPGNGLVYPINALFLVIGVVALLLRRDKTTAIVLGWFYFGSVASSLTREAPHTLRAITMLPSPMILIAVGFLSSFKYIKKKLTINHRILAILYLLIIGFSFVRYFNVYFGDYRRNYSWSWQYGYKEVVNYIKDNYDSYDKIIISKKYGEPHEFILFYWPWDPVRYQNDGTLVRFNQSNWYWVDNFNKFLFVNDWEIIQADSDPNSPFKDFDSKVFYTERKVVYDCNSNKCLLITSPGNVPDGWNKLETINFLDNKPAFEIYDN